MPLVEQLEQTQYLIRILTSRLKQLVLIFEGVHVQQTTYVVLHVNIRVINGLPIHGNDVLSQ
jgi:hypothetical protein